MKGEMVRYETWLRNWFSQHSTKEKVSSKSLRHQNLKALYCSLRKSKRNSF